jgi:hypothetical protein
MNVMTATVIFKDSEEKKKKYIITFNMLYMYVKYIIKQIIELNSVHYDL